MTAQTDYFDAAIRHQIGIRNFSSGESRRIVELLEKADRELTVKLRERLIALGGVTDFTSERFRLLLQDMRVLRIVTMRQLRGELTPNLLELATMEVGFETRMLQSSIPIEIDFATVSARQLREIVFRRPFQGRLLRGWYMGLAQTDRANLVQAIQLGLAQGESVQQIVRRVSGTRANNFTDGALAITRRNAEAVTRTAINHVSNAAREAVWQENQDIIVGLRWTATLDGRTSGICRGRDGKVATIGVKPVPPGFKALVPNGARPPAHINCRSVMVAILDGAGIVGKRPFVVDTRNRRRREIDFRKIARERGISIQTVRANWAAQNIGQLPGATSYDSFLRRQTPAFQDEVLGRTKGKLFRAGERVDEFQDRLGNDLTLSQLSDTSPDVFERAGLDPDDF